MSARYKNYTDETPEMDIEEFKKQAEEDGFEEGLNRRDEEIKKAAAEKEKKAAAEKEKKAAAAEKNAMELELPKGIDKKSPLASDAKCERQTESESESVPVVKKPKRKTKEELEAEFVAMMEWYGYNDRDNVSIPTSHKNLSDLDPKFLRVGQAYGEPMLKRIIWTLSKAVGNVTIQVIDYVDDGTRYDHKTSKRVPVYKPDPGFQPYEVQCIMDSINANPDIETVHLQFSGGLCTGNLQNSLLSNDDEIRELFWKLCQMPQVTSLDFGMRYPPKEVDYHKLYQDFMVMVLTTNIEYLNIGLYMSEPFIDALLDSDEVLTAFVMSNHFNSISFSDESTVDGISGKLFTLLGYCSRPISISFGKGQRTSGTLLDNMIDFVHGSSNVPSYERVCHELTAIELHTQERETASPFADCSKLVRAYASRETPDATKALKKLILPMYVMTEESMKDLYDLVVCGFLEDLDITFATHRSFRCSDTVDDITTYSLFGQALCNENCRIKSLRIAIHDSESRCREAKNFNTISAMLLAGAIHCKSLESLEINRMNFNELISKQIYQILIKTTSLKRFILYGPSCYMGSDKRQLLKMIVYGLTFNGTVKYLDLPWCDLMYDEESGRREGQAFVTMILRNTTLRRIKLTSNICGEYNYEVEGQSPENFVRSMRYGYRWDGLKKEDHAPFFERCWKNRGYRLSPSTIATYQFLNNIDMESKLDNVRRIWPDINLPPYQRDFTGYGFPDAVRDGLHNCIEEQFELSETELDDVLQRYVIEQYKDHFRRGLVIVPGKPLKPDEFLPKGKSRYDSSPGEGDLVKIQHKIEEEQD